MKTKQQKRLKRATKLRVKARELGAYTISVYKTSKHTYAQLQSPKGDTILSASTVEKEIRGQLNNTSNIEAAKLVGKTVAERAKQAGYEKVSFDRSGFKYHGRVQALADASRAAGLQF